ncbi:MAG: hypothetical protein LBB13_01735 [Rickettsiales bacterium]|nr:hypothetical protein [Rickettsiales bacterium]
MVYKTTGNAIPTGNILGSYELPKILEKVSKNQNETKRFEVINPVIPFTNRKPDEQLENSETLFITGEYLVDEWNRVEEKEQFLSNLHKKLSKEVDYYVNSYEEKTSPEEKSNSGKILSLRKSLDNKRKIAGKLYRKLRKIEKNENLNKNTILLGLQGHFSKHNFYEGIETAKNADKRLKRLRYLYKDPKSNHVILRNKVALWLQEKSSLEKLQVETNKKIKAAAEKKSTDKQKKVTEPVKSVSERRSDKYRKKAEKPTKSNDSRVKNLQINKDSSSLPNF